MQTLRFTKMHGLGNDYIYVNCLSGEPVNPEELAKRVSDRHFGIGGDGLVLILPSTIADFKMRMFNADGSEGRMCGNAVRCIGKYLFDRGITQSTKINLETKAGIKVIDLAVSHGKVQSATVDMGEPILIPDQIPVKIPGQQVVSQPLPGIDANLLITCVSMGNPHAVIFVPELSDSLVLKVGPQIERHPAFPDQVNVEFVVVNSPSDVTMRVWERGSGETLACGTGASAVCVAGVLNGLTERLVTVHLLGGDLRIEWRVDNHIYKTGPATTVFDGEMEL